MLNILVVEDDREEMEYCCEAIRRCLDKCNILRAENAETALEIMQEKPIDIFFLDVELPGWNGFKLAEEIRSQERYSITSIVFVTGFETNQLTIHKQYHNYEYIEKPYTLKYFDFTIRPLLKSLDLQKENRIKNKAVRKKMVMVECRDSLKIVPMKEILFIETQGRDLILHTEKQKITGIRTQLEKFITDANDDYFIRCHKSYAVYVKNIVSIENVNRRLWYARFRENEDEICQISQTYYDNVIALYTKAFKE